jgi:antitoxin (DNA-binding transcriptional repressor) of toxin-antitoxin stability system
VRAIGIKDLKNKLSEYVRIAAAGETVLVTDRDRVVAELGPPTPGRAETLRDARLAESVRIGWIQPKTGLRGVPPRGAPFGSLEEILTDLDESRADREL